jgi:hypothetical protein
MVGGRRPARASLTGVPNVRVSQIPIRPRPARPAADPGFRRGRGTGTRERQAFAGAHADFDPFTKHRHFRLNTLETTPNAPAWADIVLEPENFLLCKGASIALCYYSGPAGTTPCELRPDGKIADCTCYRIPEGSPYFVDINAILNLDVYLATVDVCGVDGSDCLPAGTKPAPVCHAINKNKLIPRADVISTFSQYLASEMPIGQTECAAAPYAGCMTAPCKETGETDPVTGLPLVSCACPVYDGKYQVGQDGAQCSLGAGLVWSAAYSPNSPTIPTFPTLPSCVPDAPSGIGCPLLSPKPPDLPAVPAQISCSDVCSEYGKSNNHGIEVGYTCDATLCTASTDDADLVAVACGGLSKNPISEIIALETAVGYSCSASQICGCTPKKKTSEAMFELNARQRDRGIVPQCDLNGTLCGEPKKAKK